MVCVECEVTIFKSQVSGAESNMRSLNLRPLGEQKCQAFVTISVSSIVLKVRFVLSSLDL